MNRRYFLGTVAAGAASWALAPRAFAAENKIVVGVMGMGGRGMSLASTFLQVPNVEVAYVCDVDKRRTGEAVTAVEKIQKKAPKGVGDFRTILEDKAVDVLVVATCNHWHAPAAILGCAAGKHVYVEKPCSHNPREGELLVEAARKHKKFVQMGNQRRSRTRLQEGILALKEGIIGRVYLATCTYNNNRPSIGTGKEVEVPEWLDYEMWQGPALARTYKDNYLHYNWHWFWHWGNGELGNNGVHTLDICRWGLGVDYPVKVSSTGGRYHFNDDQETPDTHCVNYDFADRKTIIWKGLSCTRAPHEDVVEELFVGEKGSLGLTGTGYIVYDAKGKEIKKETGKGSDVDHAANLLAAVRDGKALNSEIEEGHKSTLMCHLGNISQRVGRTLKCDGKNGHILDDKEANALWTREYTKKWEPKV